MKQLSNEQIMDYLDGALSPEETARIEQHLTQNEADREIVEELRFATTALQDFDTAHYGAEPLRVSENFWPELREKLGPAPKRSLLGQISKSLGSIFGPTSSTKTRLSLGTAFAAIVLALGVMFFLPKDATQPLVAAPITSADQAFITQSIQKHETYMQTSPIAGDVTATESGAEDDNEEANP